MLLVETTGGAFTVNCIRRSPAIQTSDPELGKSNVGPPWDPTLEREARVLDHEPLTATENIVPEAELRPRIPKHREPETSSATILHLTTLDRN